MKKILHLSIFLLSLRAFACDCNPPDITEKFIRSDFVANVTILKIYPNKGNEAGYKADIQINELFKGENLKSIYIYGRSDNGIGSSCDMYIPANTKLIAYAIKNRDGNFGIGMCSGIMYLDYSGYYKKKTLKTESELKKQKRELEILQTFKSKNINHTDRIIYREKTNLTNELQQFKGIQLEKKFGIYEITGVSSVYQEYQCDSSFGIFGIYFYPYALPFLFNIPSLALSDQMLDLQSFLGKEGRMLEERILGAVSNEERMKIMTDFLRRRLRDTLPNELKFQQVIQSLVNYQQEFTIEKLAADCNLSRRQFERQFLNYAGLSPQKYYRILRFQHATEFYKNKDLNLAHLALDCGYYDQAHFIHEFTKFSGYQPKAYFSGKVTGVEWRDC
ncbi:helix-turn-helix domain-containing protein [Algoriphagus sp.]|uniref:helix-turn-helix domain-containing protein n=1 Tax=Algoriphagus sp. TaxID=1872435 RepID=UPI00262F5993|nr:helix-turn-helix domain-containing protein [Algoriphagus sp.]